MQNIVISEITEGGFKSWDDYVFSHREANCPHLSGWMNVIEDTFGHDCMYISASQNGKIVGILPLVHMKSRIFGSFLISVPYLNYGGILADNEEIEKLLEVRAISIARDLGVDFLELRHVKAKNLNLLNKQHKVNMLLTLPHNYEALWKDLKSTVRRNIRKGEKNALVVEYGGLEKLNDFYKVFSINMRDLGTPVYSKTFFENILKEFKKTKVFVVYNKKIPVAGGLVMGLKDKLDIPWVSSLRKYNYLNGNSLMYWHILKYACESGYNIFDFGRCTPHESVYNFKKKWGAQPVNLNWQYWVNNGSTLPEISPKNKKYQSYINIWKNLPVTVTNFVGPYIVRSIP